MRFIILFILTILSASLHAQVSECSYSWSEPYIVQAEGGLKLRSQPGIESSVLALIPNQSKISVCYSEDTPRDKIGNIKGSWVKCFWQDLEGYVFDHYIQSIDRRGLILGIQTEMDLVNTWGESQFLADQQYVGLYVTEDPEVFDLRKVEMEKSMDNQFISPKNKDEIPVWVFAGLQEKKGIKGKLVNKMIYIGEQIRLLDGIIYGNGAVKIHETWSNDLSLELNPYELRYLNTNGEKPVDQLLLKMNCHGDSHRHVYEARAVVNFIGDLDGDGKDDILTTTQFSYKGWDHFLFSTKYSDGENRFQEIYIGGGSE
ncbi:MAG: SH3 domain-containing protein [Bacteroidetes bacterium]|nr:SH3 domain-containing protein [Bacteroidota bacterium]